MKSTVGEVYNLDLPAKPADKIQPEGEGNVPPVSTVDRKGSHTMHEEQLVDTGEGLNSQYDPYKK